MEFADIESVDDLALWAKEWADNEEAHNAFRRCMSYIRQNLNYDKNGEVLLILKTNLAVVNFKNNDRLDVYFVEINNFQFAMPYDAKSFKYTDARIVEPDVPTLDVKTH